MNDYCFKCASNPCKCGEIYKTIKKPHIYKTMMSCISALKERFNEDVNVTINGINFEECFKREWKEPLFNETFIQLVTSSSVPRKWNTVFTECSTLDDLFYALKTGNEDTFPLLGIVLFTTHVHILIREEKTTIPLFIDIIKRLYDRETPIRELIESCGSNYKSLCNKINEILSVNNDSWKKEDSVYSIINTYIRHEQEGNIRLFCTDLIYRLFQCYVFGSVEDVFCQIYKYTDELFYVDEVIFNYLNSYDKPSDASVIRLI